ncbi:Uncharacterized protein APZ42_004683 [Daphnia magna]|uniref:Uncharacterized protein n=1 Tax=Daphnia magna TaxID=35525 RepID=A0A164GWJ1_9CRUS|nr:Uncharacterized protein APZ42_004683 [Daphnia magna]
MFFTQFVPNSNSGCFLLPRFQISFIYAKCGNFLVFLVVNSFANETKSNKFTDAAMFSQLD